MVNLNKKEIKQFFEERNLKIGKIHIYDDSVRNLKIDYIDGNITYKDFVSFCKKFNVYLAENDTGGNQITNAKFEDLRIVSG